MLKRAREAKAAIDRPEVEMLLLCVRPCIDAEEVQRIHAIGTAGCNWDAILDLACAHGVTPLLYRGLKLAGPDLVPPAVLRDLRAWVRQNAVRGLALSGELIRVLSLLKENGIQAVPFKGPVLSALAYGDVTLRDLSDLDILVGRCEAQRARAVLMSHGFLSEKKAVGFDEAPPVHKHYGLTHPESGVHLELHWRVSPSYFASSIDYRGLWDRLEPLSFLGARVPCLACQDLLAVLCGHGYHHCWESLVWICDLAWLISSRPQADWDSIIESAIGDGLRQRPVLLGLSLAHQLLGMPLPGRIKPRMDADRLLEPLTAFIRQRILFARADTTTRPEQCLFHLRAAESLPDKMLYGAGLICRICTPNTDDHAVVALPRGLRLLYYPLRLIRLAWTLARWAARQFLRRGS
jgi:hypothetical protein